MKIIITPKSANTEDAYIILDYDREDTGETNLKTYIYKILYEIVT